MTASLLIVNELWRMTINSRTRSNAVMAIGRGVLVGLVLGVMFIAGFLLGTRSPASASLLAQAVATPDSEVGSYPLLTQAQTLLNQNYLRQQPSQRDLEYAAIRGILSLLNDKY